MMAEFDIKHVILLFALETNKGRCSCLRLESIVLSPFNSRLNDIVLLYLYTSNLYCFENG